MAVDAYHGEVDAEEPYPLTVEARTGFHGSNRDLRGTHILSAAERRGRGIDVAVNWQGSSSDQFVNYWHGMERGFGGNARERALDNAWNWATDAEFNGDFDASVGAEGRPRVYEGVAEGVHGADPNLLDDYLTETDRHDEQQRGTHDVPLNWELTEDLLGNSQGAPPMAAERFRVTDTHWIPPGQPGKAVQGTLPGVNWNQFGAPNVGNPEDVAGFTPRNYGSSAAGLSEDDVRHANRRAREQRVREQRALEADHGPGTLGSDVRDAERRSVEAGQMRLPGF